MTDADETPEWWDEVIYLPLNTKTEAKRVIKLCREGEFRQTWKPQWSTYNTSEGRIRERDYLRAQDILMDVLKPDTGRPGQHDWKLIETLVLEVSKTMPKPINKTKLRRMVSRIYFERCGLRLHPNSGTFKTKVRKWLSE